MEVSHATAVDNTELMREKERKRMMGNEKRRKKKVKPMKRKGKVGTEEQFLA